jgi:hypothetical protein
MVFMQVPGRFAAIRARQFDDITRSKAAISRDYSRRLGSGRLAHEIDHRDCRRRTAGMLHQRLKCSLRRRQDRPRRRWPELRLQRSRQRVARGTLRRDPPAMRRKIFGELLRRQDAVGDVRRRTTAAGLEL